MPQRLYGLNNTDSVTNACKDVVGFERVPETLLAHPELSDAANHRHHRIGALEDKKSPRSCVVGPHPSDPPEWRIPHR